MTDILETTARGASKATASLGVIAIGVSAVLVAGIGTAVAVGSSIGGGQQPEDVLPKNVIALAKVDLAPSLGQRKAVYDLSRKFDKVDVKSADSVKDDLLKALFESDSTVDYQKDIKPWLGDRAGIGAIRDESADHVAPIAAVQYTDKNKATRTLKDAQKDSADNPFAFAFSGDYVIIANTQDEADKYAKADSHLSDNDTFKNAIDALDGDQIVTGWADVKGVYDVIPAEQRAQIKLDANPSGSFVVGAHADSNYLEIVGKAVDVGDSLKQYGSGTFGNGRGHNLIATMPIESTVALELTGLGDTLTKAYDKLSVEPGFTDIEGQAQQYGLHLPQDLRTVLGTDVGVGVFGNLNDNPRVVGHVLTEQPDEAIKILTKVPSPEDTPPFALEKESSNSYFIGTDAGAIALARKGTLGDSAPFKRALPDAQDAGFALYVSIGRAAELGGDQVPAWVSHLEAFGMTASGTTGEFRIRLTVS
ncbi:MAG: hypothetical protein QOJ79_386 [Actinomycetota bacterium]|jgi:hypothetical protein|nr:hypothetical protein [Actinomycetota bacterium]